MIFRTAAFVGLLIYSGVTAPAKAQAAPAKLINGAGATFPFPIYAKWFSEFNKANPQIEINYQSIGSGAGIKQLIARTVDFGASDAPMSDAELAAAPAPIIHVPTVLGAVAITYNLPSVAKPIRFTSDVLADVFLGKIKKWNDPRLLALNPGAALPNQDVIVISRGDSSGTTFVFTEYLAKISAEWKSKVGSGKAVKWPAGMAQKGNEGVTGQLKNTPGAIGYVELVYAVSQKLPLAELKNRAGEFVAPTLKSVADAAAGALKSMPEDFRVSIVDADGKGAYPIASFTYLLVYKKMPKDKGSEIVKFLEWSMTSGQKMAPAESYAALPASLVSKVQTAIKKMELE